MTWFCFVRLPSPLTGNQPHSWNITVPYVADRGWDFCPFLGLLVVGTRCGKRCVRFKDLAIESLLTVRTRSFEVHFRNMSDGEEYCDDHDYAYPSVALTLAEGTSMITQVELMLTSRRLAAKVSRERAHPYGVYVWKWEGGTQYLVSRFIPLLKTSLSHGSVEGVF